ncbi:MAG: hypothetical protein HN712_20655 [Gemmatimonadetes bacterium]|nr:hypothetical protein [Gemmatimonadota bacterium]MBT6145062.1 hypothetical protein [Gemmatimonadota bacterium]MBT7862738.1 hypothetical protein [Gemmatimonadota bacterium]
MVRTATNQLLKAVLLALIGTTLSAPDPVEAGAWTLPSGRVWTKVSWFRQTTQEWYIDAPEPVLRSDGTFGEHAIGERRPYRFDGEYDSRAIFFEGFVGLTDWLDLGVQVPYFDQVFDDATRTEAPSAAGLSDLRVFAKTRLLQKPLILTLKLGAKMPTGEFRNEDGLIPVGEGQWDFDVIVQAGRSLWPLPAYANVDVGYRVRTKNDEIDRDPGDEWLVNAEIGAQPRPWLSVALKYEMLRSGKGETFGIRTASLIKRVSYLAPTIGVRVHGDTWLEAAMRSSLGGRNFPAGRQYVVGLSTGFDAGGIWP